MSGGEALPNASTPQASGGAIRDHRATKQVWKFVALYYAIACGFTWIVWVPLVLGPSGLKLIKTAVSLPVFACIGTLGPFLGCFISHRVQTGNWRAVRLFPQSSMRFVWLLLGPFLVLFCFFFIFPALISTGGPQVWHWHAGVLAGIWVPMFNYNLLGGPLFEEFGWRGFLQSRLQEILPPWIAAICVGVMWAAWHLPLFLVAWSSASPFTFLLILLGLAAVMALAFNGSGKAVVVAILMHSAFNASPRFLVGFMGNVATRKYLPEESFLAFSFLLAGAAAVFLSRGRLCAPCGDRREGLAGNDEVRA
jgi:membrane protease YdiL (CAAX protease family)